MTARRVSGEAVPPEHADAVQVAKSDWTQFDSDKILVVLEETETGGKPCLERCCLEARHRKAYGSAIIRSVV